VYAPVPEASDLQYSPPPEQRSVQQSAPPAAAMPNADEVSARGGVAALHLDLHVYATQPQQRFIFVNARKYKEGDTLAEGPLVEQITPDGAVLNFRGSRFKLSND
jgi:general secretion pathway protein B